MNPKKPPPFCPEHLKTSFRPTLLVFGFELPWDLHSVRALVPQRTLPSLPTGTIPGEASMSVCENKLSYTITINPLLTIRWV